MEKDINLIFHNHGLRSYIEVDLCRECPRQDDKGCCGYYSPVFYPSDFAYLLKKQPHLLDYIFSLDNLTVLDASVTVNSQIDGSSYHCRFHQKEGGCLLSQELRESICRHFVCPGIAWEDENELKHWKEFFTKLADYEIYINNRVSARLHEMGLSLRQPENRTQFFKQMLEFFEEETASLPAFLNDCPAREEARIKRLIQYGSNWTL